MATSAFGRGEDSAAPLTGKQGRGGQGGQRSQRAGREAAGEKDRQFVTALARGLEVLRAFQDCGGPLGNQEIAKRTGLPKPTVSRLTHTLKRLGYIVHDERLSKYRIGPGVLALGQSNFANTTLLRVARPFMQELREESGASVALGTRDRLEMVYFENLFGKASTGLRLAAGTRLPIGTTAMGRTYLAALSAGERAYFMKHLELVHRARWPGIRDAIEAAVAQFEERGFCFAADEWQREIAAVGAPIMAPGGRGHGGLTTGAPAVVIGRAKLCREVGPHLVHVASTIQSELQNA
jgi:DNA-binding IclR family transcriptional regulator